MSSAEKYKNIAYLIIAVITIAGFATNSIVSYARANDKIESHDGILKDHDIRLRNVEDNLLEQKIVLQGIDEKQKESRDDMKDVLEMLHKITSGT